MTQSTNATITNKLTEKHSDGLKRMDVAVKIYSLETDLGH